MLELIVMFEQEHWKQRCGPIWWYWGKSERKHETKEGILRKRIITISRIESILINMVKMEVRLKSTIEMGTSFTLKLVLLAARKPLRIKLDWLTESALIILMLRMEKASFVLVIVRQQQ